LETPSPVKQGVQRTVEHDQLDRSLTSASTGVETAEPLRELRFAVLSVIAVLLVLIAHVVWLSQERGPMLWDDSGYAGLSLELYDGLDANGLPGLLQRFIYGTGAAKAPLIELLPVPFFLLFGRGSQWAFYGVELLGFVLVCLGAYRLVRRLSNG